MAVSYVAVLVGALCLILGSVALEPHELVRHTGVAAICLVMLGLYTMFYAGTIRVERKLVGLAKLIQHQCQTSEEFPVRKGSLWGRTRVQAALASTGPKPRARPDRPSAWLNL